MPFTYTPGEGGGWVVGTAEPTVPPFGEWVYTIQPVGGWELEDMTQPATFNGGFASIGPAGPAGAAGSPGVVAATAPITYNSGTQTVGIDPDPIFGTVTATSLAANDGTHLLQLFGSYIYFPDDTSQTTAGISPAAAASTYYPLTNPSGFITSSALSGYATEAWVGSQGYLTSASLTGYATEAWVGSQGYITSSALSPYLTSAAAASTYQTLSGMSSYLTTSAAASTYLTQSNAASTYQTQAGMSSYYLASNPAGYVTASTAPVTSVAGKTGAVTLAVADVSGAAPTASPSLTGTPTAPTAAAATNTTQIATTAFVQQEVPAASTSTAGKVQLATNAQALTATSTTLAMTPDDVRYVITGGGYMVLPSHAFSTITTSGTGASSAREAFNGWIISAPTSATGYAFGAGRIVNPRRGAIYNGQINFSLPLAFGARLSQNSTGTIDTASVFRLSIGKATPLTAGDIVAGNNAIMVKVAGGGAMQLLVANGTTLSTVTSSFTPANQTAFDVLVTSDGSGNVTLYVNGSSVATSTGGPTTSSTASGNHTYCNEVENTTTLTNTRSSYVISGTFMYTAG